MAHRYFMQQSSLLIRGFEPSRVVSGTDSGAAAVLSKAVPEHADMLFGGAHGKAGFSVDDTVAFLAALEQLVFDSESELLEIVYRQFGMETSRLLTTKQVRRLIEAYMVNWMLGEDQKSTMMLLRNRTLLETSFPHWTAIKGFVDGRVKTMDFRRAQKPKGFSQSIMSARYSFDDVHEVVGGITQSFQLFWESMPQLLIRLRYALKLSNCQVRVRSNEGAVGRYGQICHGTGTLVGLLWHRS